MLPVTFVCNSFAYMLAKAALMLFILEVDAQNLSTRLAFLQYGIVLKTYLTL